MVRAARFTKQSLHVAVLVFTSYWLIATSAPDVPARDCYTGLPSRASVAVQLGDSIGDDAAGAAGAAGAPDADSGTSAAEPPSCRGLDGMVAGGLLVLDLDRGPRPLSNGGACYRHELAAIDGVSGVSSPEDSRVGGDALVSTSGSYASPTEVGCRGGWNFVLTPETPPLEGQTMDPLAAGPSERWRVERYMTFEPEHSCSGFDRGEAACSDVFSVESITLVP